MKNLILIFFSLLFSGCDSGHLATNSTNNVVVTNIIYQPVEGAFGWKLGQIIPVNQDLLIETNGEFSKIILVVNSSNVLCSLQAWTDFALPPEETKALLKDFESKYGFIGCATNQDGIRYIFGFPDTVGVMLNSSKTTIWYKNAKLSKDLDDEEEKENSEKFKSL